MKPKFAFPSCNLETQNGAESVSVPVSHEEDATWVVRTVSTPLLSRVSTSWLVLGVA